MTLQTTVEGKGKFPDRSLPFTKIALAIIEIFPVFRSQIFCF